MEKNSVKKLKSNSIWLKERISLFIKLSKRDINV